MPKPVAVIDIGSNTIKLLVAQLSPENRIEVLLRESSETRLGKGLNAKEPRFDSEMIERAEKAVCELLNKAEKLSPAATRIVATSAVRDAVNRDEFTSALRKQTGIEPDVLTGEQEAEFI